ncbi:MAG: tyrosine-protein phosphatase, partial [Anaerolineae bacterium]|nr:tyrosine-protein phosphatase [Anaerolineae bacterium]
LFGVPEEAVFQDYLLSNDFILPEYRALIDKYVALGVQEEILISILGVRQEYLEESFRVMRDQFGGIEGYFAEGLGIDPAGQQALREQFLEQV